MIAEFFNAIKFREYDKVVNIMEYKPILLLEVNELMQNALHLVAEGGHNDIADFLLPYQGIPSLL